MNRFTSTPAFALAALLAAPAAFAEPHMRGKTIDIAEAEARAEERFAAADTDSDGIVSLAEFVAIEPPKRRAGRHGKAKRWRHKRKGQPDEAAREAAEARLFEIMDTNSDNTLSEDEFSREAVRDAKMTVRKERLFARLDADGSGGLTPEEISPANRLRAADTDGDGQVTPQERRAARKARREQG